MRHKTSGYFLLSALLVSLILGLCILLNLRCPQAVSDDALTQEQLTRGVTLTGWQQTAPGTGVLPLKRLPTSRNWCSAFPPGRWTPCRKGWSPPTSVVRPSGCGRCPAGRPRSL